MYFECFWIRKRRMVCLIGMVVAGDTSVLS